MYRNIKMGCAIFFVAMINHPELNDKIEVMMALAPAASLAHMKSPLHYIAPFQEQIQVSIIPIPIIKIRFFVEKIF